MSYYKELANSWSIPQTYLGRCSLARIGESLVWDLDASSTADSHEHTDQCAQEKRDAEQGGRVGQGRGGGGGPGSQGGGRGGRGRGRGGRGRGQGGGRGRGDRGARVRMRPEGQLFRETAPTIIEVAAVVTPKKGSSQQTTIIPQIAKTFLEDQIVIDIQSKAYDPYDEILTTTPDRKRYPFHRTRKSKLTRFKQNGVYPEYRQNELCDGVAFYTTNSIKQAITHVFYVSPKLINSAVDPIIVLMFSIDVSILHGYRTVGNPSRSITSRWYRDGDEEDREEFFTLAKHNLSLEHESELDPASDVEIGPICLSTLPDPVVLDNWTEEDISLIQVASCTTAHVHDYFSHSLVQVSLNTRRHLNCGFHLPDPGGEEG
ncbi:hypothetical protein M413DRAFT_201399 [Hebeloma cylindrosporum]|uniref:Uncharacterized protein n=1 Tax=Hebeloma cylindrosporum TaxID=76867 RepID=A0A0C2Z2K9_HEBCY|nr:hypothetical protein M413DRAFT_201399 [Hebeloma cylindrosporum h7]